MSHRGANVSPAVMAQRHEGRDSLDLFPTQPWAVRAFVEHVLIGALGVDPATQSVWEPAAGLRHMSGPLAEYFGTVSESDIADYGAGVDLFDFLSCGGLLSPKGGPFGQRDWIITNPPFKDMERWILLAMAQARRGVALFGRLQLLEGVRRFDRVWSPYRDHAVAAVYAERVPLVKGKVDPEAASATAYAWIVIDKAQVFANPFPGSVTVPTVLIPPCRRSMERPGDFAAIYGDAP